MWTRKVCLAAAMVAVGLFMSHAVAEEQEKAEVGKPAPQFTLQDQDGKTVSLSDYEGKIVVLEWINPECPYVVRHYNEKTMMTLAEKYRDQEVVWLAIDSSYTLEDEASREWINKYDLTYPILNDASGDVGRLYAARTTPQMYIIDREGTLVYNGGIDDDPRGTKEQRVQYTDNALAEIVAGSSVSVAETRPYGCTVKYRN